jgi:ATP-dependent Clp protease ATP-binding subunit ClpA
MGARPMARAIRDQLRKPLADELLFGKLARGGEVHVDLIDDVLSFKTKAREEQSNDVTLSQV